VVNFSPDLIGRTIKLIREQAIIVGQDRVLVGCSGGIDSATLLFVLNETKREMHFDLGVAHVNHLLRGDESDRDEAFVRDTAARYGIPFFLERANVREYAASRGQSLQHAGRNVRYRFLDEVADREGYTRIAMAHNLDDQIETFILRLIKGSGLRGLSSIPPARDRIIRPFLEVYRSEIVSFAEYHSIPYVEDSSNEKIVYERNYIRHKIMPLCHDLNPAFREKIASLLMDIHAFNAAFDQKKDVFMKLVRGNAEELTVPLLHFTKLDREVRYRVMADIFARLTPSFVPLREHIHLIEKIIGSTRPNLRLDLPDGLKVNKVYGRLVFTLLPAPDDVREITALQAGTNHIPLLNIDIHLQYPKKAPSSFPGNSFIAYLDADKCGDLAVRTFRPGDRFQPLGMARPVKVKDFFISRKIPLQGRKHIPLIVSGNDIIWVAGHRIDERYKLTPDTHNILKVTVKKTCQPPSNYD
jgi:tRNA(Ile)-lysidine synthase